MRLIAVSMVMMSSNNSSRKRAVGSLVELHILAFSGRCRASLGPKITSHESQGFLPVLPRLTPVGSSAPALMPVSIASFFRGSAFRRRLTRLA